MSAMMHNTAALDDDDEYVVLPSDHAIRLIENLLAPVGQDAIAVSRETVLKRARAHADDQVVWWVDHVLSQLCTHRCVERIRVEHAQLAYRASPQWSKRRAVICGLCPPRVRYPSRHSVHTYARSL